MEGSDCHWTTETAWSGFHLRNEMEVSDCHWMTVMEGSVRPSRQRSGSESPSWHEGDICFLPTEEEEED